MATIKANNAFSFSLSWTKNPQLIKGIYFNAHSSFEQEVIRILISFQLMSYHTVITLDQEDNCQVEKYMGKINGMKGTL